MSPEEQLALVKQHYALNTAGDFDGAAELVEFTLAGYDGPPMQAVEVNTFRGNQICEIRPYYFDATSMVEAAKTKRS